MKTIQHITNQDENLSFCESAVFCYLEKTISINGIRTRKKSGVLSPQIPSIGLDFLHLFQVEFVARSICRNKAEFIRTNKTSRFIAVVEALLHLLQVGKFPLLLTIKNSVMLYQFQAPNHLDLGNKQTSSLAKFIRNPISYENLSLCKNQKAVYPCLAFAKSNAERGNSNILSVANDSTPILNRAFFVRGLRTPKETNRSDFGGVGFFSMVGRIGQRLIVGCLPLIAVFHPDTHYRQIVESLAVDLDSQNLSVELSTMLYQFLITTGDKPLKITILANSEQEARSRLQLSSSTILIARKKGGVYA